MHISATAYWELDNETKYHRQTMVGHWDWSETSASGYAVYQSVPFTLLLLMALSAIYRFCMEKWHVTGQQKVPRREMLLKPRH